MEDLQSWLDGVLSDSQIQMEYWKSQEQEDLDGLVSILANFLQSSDSISGRGVLLTGADSHSRYSVAAQIAELLEQAEFDGLFLDGMDLDGDDAVSARKKLDALLNHCFDEGRGICLVLEGMGECPCGREVLRHLGQRLCQCRMRPDESVQLFVVLPDEQPIPALLRNCLLQLRLQLPNEERRLAYLEEYGKTLRNYLSLPVFAQCTEGVSYVQLQDLIGLAEGYLDSLDGRGMSEKELRDFLEAQLPARRKDPMMQTLCDSVQELVEHFKKMPAAAPVQVSVANQMPEPVSTLTPDTPKDTSRESIEKLPPVEVASDLWGKDIVEEIRNRAEQIMQQA